eukprot:601042-Rhodomonas_salina.2
MMMRGACEQVEMERVAIGVWQARAHANRPCPTNTPASVAARAALHTAHQRLANIMSRCDDTAQN